MTNSNTYFRTASIYNLCLRFIYSKRDIEFGSNADHTTPFVYGENFEKILSELEKHVASISEWLS